MVGKRHAHLAGAVRIQISSFLVFAQLFALTAVVPSIGCGGGNPPRPSSVTVSVSPSTVNVLLGNSQQFAATVTGTSDASVAWTVNGVAGGNSMVGTITSAGLYSAPKDLPALPNVSVAATSQADPTKEGSATVTITSDVSLSINASPARGLVETGGQLQLSVTVSGKGMPAKNISWAVNGIQNGDSAFGTIGTTTLDTAIYTAPETTPSPASITIKAVSAADPSKSASLNVTIATPIPSVLVAGGQTSLTPGNWVNTAEVFDKTTQTWIPTQNVIPNAPRSTAGGLCAPNAALLGNGKVLLAGGGCSDAGITTNAANLFDPANNRWTTTGSMVFGRDQYGMVSRTDGRAMAIGGCAGGCEGPNILGQFYNTVSKSTELYDPQTETWTTAAPLNAVHGNFALNNQLQGAAQLLDGRVLACGGSDANITVIATCEIYDPTADSWSVTGALPQACEGQTCPLVLLPNGNVLTITNDGLGSIVFDPAQGSWKSSGSLVTRQIGGTLTVLGNGLVLLTGGSSDGTNPANAAELYDPATGLWRLTAAMSASRLDHVAVLLSDGRVLAAGGEGTPTTILSTAEIYDPANETWVATASMSQPRLAPVIVGLPARVVTKGATRVLVAGGGTSFSPGNWTNTAEVFDASTHTWSPTLNVIPNAPPAAVGGLCAPNAALLGNGKVLLAGGGCSDAGITTNAASFFDPAANQWTTTASMAFGRDQFGMITLSDGNAMAVAGCAGGCEGPNAQGQFFGTVSRSAEIYDASTGNWRTVASLNTVHGNFALNNQLQGAVRLRDGRVLACGGSDANITVIATCEIYDPTADSWSVTGALPQACEGQTCPLVLLPNGNVLTITNDGLGSIVFDPAQGSWKSSGSLATRQIGGTLTVLSNGLVLLTGGSSDGSGANPISAAELYDPATDVWRLTASMSTTRRWHATLLLSDGEVLVAGGQGTASAILASAEIYDPATETWVLTALMSQPRLAPVVVGL